MCMYVCACILRGRYATGVPISAECLHMPQNTNRTDNHGPTVSPHNAVEMRDNDYMGIYAVTTVMISMRLQILDRY